MSAPPWPPPKSRPRPTPHLPATRRLDSLSCRSSPQVPCLSQLTIRFPANLRGILLRVHDGPDVLAVCCSAFAVSSARLLECSLPRRVVRLGQEQRDAWR